MTDYQLSYTAEDINRRLGLAGDAVTYTPQTLTPEQKAQARENIGAMEAGYEAALEPLIVTYKDGDMTRATHTATEIFAHVQKGGTVYFVRNGNNQIALTAVEPTVEAGEDTYGAAEFEWGFDNTHKYIVVDDEGNIEEDFVRLADFAEVKALEEQIAKKQDVQGVYELIEAFTLQADTVLERTQEPDGTPYKLERVLIKASAISDTYTFFTAIVQCNGTNIAYLFHNFTANQNGREYGITEAFQECGYWRSINHVQNHQTHVYGYVRYGGTEYTMKHAVSQYPYITRIFGAGALPYDVEVEIWGVRADSNGTVIPNGDEVSY